MGNGLGDSLELGEALSARLPIRLDAGLKKAFLEKCKRQGYPLDPSVQKRTLIYCFVSGSGPQTGGMQPQPEEQAGAKENLRIQPSLKAAFLEKCRQSGIAPAKVLRMIYRHWVAGEQ